ncbi:MAG TPA: DegT/DnrJ/EryC1/StrS family aminotransferase, partial [Solirubrobacteraceae bacterium]|nr:DegT/DnrJ/EryC1/StrS family aminotransferase [Solirubrobacteraceae bacterium]
VHEFEQLFARLHEYPAAVSTVSGTAALHLALIALGLGPGDEVLVPAMTFVATANAVRYTGATPVFVDADPVTYTIDPADLQAKISARTRAILVVHLFGHPADMDAIGELARAHELAVVEDASGALGARYRGRPCGTLGDIGCFSFNGNKIVTSGGGGMLLAAEPKRLEHMRHLSFQARLAGTFEYVHDEVAFNYALSNVHAAIGLAQLERLDELLAHRRALAARYAAGLADVAGLTFCAQAPWARCNYWLMSVLVDAAEYGRSREQLMAALAGVGIESRPFFVPLPDVGAHLRESPAHVPVARRLHREGLSIPSSASLDEADQDRVIAALRADL